MFVYLFVVSERGEMDKTLANKLQETLKNRSVLFLDLLSCVAQIIAP